ncbi:hypothetical protein FQA39_LY04253 [Lamprigera yunnana]|nr:hypothetical protein FQA39_LY04253 [Lamprigera yunnana]
MSRKLFGSRGKEMIASLTSFFEAERDNGGPFLPLTAVRERVAATLNISIRTVDSVSQIVKNNDALKSLKKRQIHKPVTDVETFQMDVIQNTVYRIYENSRDGKSIESCLNMWREALGTVTSEIWKNNIRHTEDEIKSGAIVKMAVVYSTKSPADVVQITLASFQTGKTRSIELRDLFRFYEENMSAIVDDLHKNKQEVIMQELEIVIHDVKHILDNLRDWAKPERPSKMFPNWLDNPIVTNNNVSEAIDYINQGEKPLALYIFSNIKKDVDLFLINTSSGGTCINDTIMQFCVPGLPFGGVGMGAYHKKFSFDTFTHKKDCLYKKLHAVGERLSSSRYPPYSAAKIANLKMFMKY